MLKKLIYTSLLAAISFNALSIEQYEVNDLKHRASVGDTSAQLLLGQLTLTKQIEVTGDINSKGSELILQAARSGNPKAQFMVGVLYEKGILGPVDLELAYSAYQDAADNGYVKAIVNMAFIQERKKDLVLARKLYSQAGDKGDVLGYLNLYNLEKSQGNVKQAEKALIDAAQAGNDSAQYIYALELLKLDTEQPLNDASPAILWLKVAAKKGNVAAMSDLISLYDRGSFISADYSLLESFLIKLNSEGDTKASFILAKYYIKRYQSYSKAWPLLTLAISNDVDGALPYKQLLLESKKVITTEKDIYVSSSIGDDDLPPVLVKTGSRFNVVGGIQNGSVFVVEDELGVYGFAQHSQLYPVNTSDVTAPTTVSELSVIDSGSEIKVGLDLVSQDEVKPNASLKEENNQKVIAVINRPVNFRVNAHPHSEIMHLFEVGSEVLLLSEDDWGWAHVVYEGTAGFVMSRAIDFDESLNAKVTE